MDSFTITVTGITRRGISAGMPGECQKAVSDPGGGHGHHLRCHHAGHRQCSIPAVAGPVLVYLIALGAYEVLTRVNYKGQLEQFDPVEYRFDGLRWQVKAGSEQVSIDWRGPPSCTRPGLPVPLQQRRQQQSDPAASGDTGAGSADFPVVPEHP